MPDNPPSFDAYYKWLGIPPEEQPANHYRLLGLQLFESDADVIDAAADRQMAHVQRYQNGPQGALSQKLLNEISAARVCLLDPQKKAAYDQSLRASRAAREPAATSSASPLAVRIEAPPAPNYSPPIISQSPPVIAPVRRGGKPRVGRRNSAWQMWIIVAAGVLAVVVLVGVLNKLLNSRSISPVASSGNSPGDAPPSVSIVPKAKQEDEPTAGLAPATTSTDPPRTSSTEVASSAEPAKEEQSWRRGLVLALTMDRADLFEQEGKQLLRDHSGQENHAELHNVEFVEGKSGEAARFAMAKSFLQCPDTASLNPVEGLTLAAWIRADQWHEDFAQGSLVSKDDWDRRTSRGFVLRAGGKGKADLTVGGNGWHGASSGTGLATAQWHHVAGTYDGRFLRLYVDGSEEARTRMESTPTPSPYPLRIGNGTFDTQRQFLGTIDEAAVWNRALSEPELAQIVGLSKAGESYCRPQE